MGAASSKESGDPQPAVPGASSPVVPLDSELTAAETSATSSSKWSACTWWQKIKGEEGVAKRDALEQWKLMGTHEREKFKAAIAQRRAAGSSEAVVTTAKTLLMSKFWSERATRTKTLEEFESKWASFAKALSAAENPATYHVQNAQDACVLS